LTSAEKQRQRENQLYEERAQPGLHFECYERDPAMKEEAKKTLSVQEYQSQLEAQRKQQEIAERKAVAPSHLTDEDLAQLRRQSQETEAQRRAALAKNNDYLFEQSSSRIQKERAERERQVKEERENHQRLQQQLAEERHYARMAKAQNAQQATGHLQQIEAVKKAQFEAKKTDITNKVQTIALQEEVSHRQREAQI
jgi:hypothetical protein